MKAFYSTARTAFPMPLPQGEDQGEGGPLSQFPASRVLARNDRWGRPHNLLAIILRNFLPSLRISDP